MQTFLPYPNFQESAAVLDNKRLGKQIIEARQIFLACTDPSYGWRNHPAVQQWIGWEGALFNYASAMACEWADRFDKIHQAFHNMHTDFHKYCALDGITVDFKNPTWLGYEPYHASHRSNLLRKEPLWYRKYWMTEPDNLPYYWPSKQFEWKESK